MLLPWKNLLLALAFLFSIPCTAQRQWGVSDSTQYDVGGDTILIAGRHKLYRMVEDEVELIRDFSDAMLPDHYIRDVDHWSSSVFYVIVGSRYIGNTTTLFKSTDAGLNWQVDESFFPATTETPSLNQMSIVGDTAYLFNGYYASEVMRSFDHGLTWQNWFASLIAHYYGIIPCGSDAFIFGMVGDGFAPSMWLVPDTLWAQQNTFFWSGCHNGGQPQCHYSLNNAYAAVVSRFDSIATAVCSTGLSVEDGDQQRTLRLAPNPAMDQISISGLASEATLLLTDALGRPCPIERTGQFLDLAHLTPGVYQLTVFHAGDRSVLRFMKE